MESIAPRTCNRASRTLKRQPHQENDHTDQFWHILASDSHTSMMLSSWCHTLVTNTHRAFTASNSLHLCLHWELMCFPCKPKGKFNQKNSRSYFTQFHAISRNFTLSRTKSREFHAISRNFTHASCFRVSAVRSWSNWVQLVVRGVKCVFARFCLFASSNGGAIRARWMHCH